MSSHSIPLPLPSFPPLYGARYSETTANTATVTTYGGLVAMEDMHDDDPESILDEHVQRVMKTPGCQSPGATNSTLGGGGRHTPPKSSRSPDGGTGPPHYPPHRGGGHSLPTTGVKGKRLRRGWRKGETDAMRCFLLIKFIVYQHGKLTLIYVSEYVVMSGTQIPLEFKTAANWRFAKRKIPESISLQVTLQISLICCTYHIDTQTPDQAAKLVCLNLMESDM